MANQDVFLVAGRQEIVPAISYGGGGMGGGWVPIQGLFSVVGRRDIVPVIFCGGGGRG